MTIEVRLRGLGNALMLVITSTEIQECVCGTVRFMCIAQCVSGSSHVDEITCLPLFQNYFSITRATHKNTPICFCIVCLIFSPLCVICTYCECLHNEWIVVSQDRGKEQKRNLKNKIKGSCGEKIDEEGNSSKFVLSVI